MLREYVKGILSEDDGGFGGFMGGGGDMGTAGAYGMHFADSGDLYNVFIKPFADVAGVAAGKTKELSQKGQTLLKVAFETVATTLIPILRDSYAEIFAKEKENIDKIRTEYSKVYQATWDAFTDNDVLVAAFMYRPDLFLTAQLARKAPQAVSKLLSVLSGGTLDKVLAKIDPTKKQQSKKGPQDFFTDFSKYFGEGVLREDENQEASPLEKLVSNKKVKAMLADSDAVKKMSRVGQEVVRGTLQDVYKQASGVLGAKSLQDLQQKTGKKLPGLDKLSQVPEQERKVAEQTLMTSVKKSMREFYIKELEAQAKGAIDAGVPKDHPYIRDYYNVISKIKQL